MPVSSRIHTYTLSLNNQKDWRFAAPKLRNEFRALLKGWVNISPHQMDRLAFWAECAGLGDPWSTSDKIRDAIGSSHAARRKLLSLLLDATADWVDGSGVAFLLDKTLRGLCDFYLRGDNSIFASGRIVCISTAPDALVLEVSNADDMRLFDELLEIISVKSGQSLEHVEKLLQSAVKYDHLRFKVYDANKFIVR